MACPRAAEIAAGASRPECVPVRGVYGTDYGDEYQRVLRRSACFEDVTICCHTEKDLMPGFGVCGGG
ncbi:unknown protein [Cronobacter turicensis z3032]|uniref:Uncharacterized protein n=1 Tax=Cronobacter turicensis (strain DSM 18703 / CCUG 55852 / LMG 23827 / z3032) TaxID=693216 RepID=C9Y555_CROTZ|nr:hypothetical protein [Cronobacter turicensis]CBA31172.1 unknown protein [Cronobacter turicensis z3032]